MRVKGLEEMMAQASPEQEIRAASRKFLSDAGDTTVSMEVSQRVTSRVRSTGFEAGFFASNGATFRYRRELSSLGLTSLGALLLLWLRRTTLSSSDSGPVPDSDELGELLGEEGLSR